ncbi:MAG: amino acid permease [Clostridioides sp.]|jgi:amino acid transporter|nr:amino acid permease [Clostridioides sp.]
MSETKKLNWYNLALMAFVMVWGFGNVVNNFANQGLTVVVSWILIFALYFVPYALIVGELGSTFKDGAGGVSSWIKSTTTKRLAYFAGWTYWVVHIPYLAQKPQGILTALGWVLRQNGSLMSDYSALTIQLVCLVIFLVFLWIASKGVSTLKAIGTVAGTAMFVMSLLYVLLMISAPAIRGVHIATPNMSLKSFVPTFDFKYFTTLSMLVFAVGGAEKISPYIHDTENPTKNFPKGMIALAIMVAACAILGSIAMGMMFDANNIPDDLMLNGAYYAFQKLGQFYGLGNILLIIYAIANMAAQISALAFSIDAPLKVLLSDSDKEFIPRKLAKLNANGTPINGYIMTAVLVGLLIVIPALGIGNMNELFKWLLNLNSVVMPMRYLWVFFAYVMLKQHAKARGLKSDYKFLKSDLAGKIVGWWCFIFTAFACILGVVPKQGVPFSSGWNFQIALNIITPFVFIALGLLLPALAKRSNNKLDASDDNQAM